MKKFMLLFGVLVLAGCGSATQITGAWKNPSPPVNPVTYKSIMVTSLSQNLKARETVERDLAAAISKTGLKAIRGIESIPPSFSDSKNVDKEQLLDRIRKTGVDGIITVALIDKETESRYVPGTYNYAPVTRFGYYGLFSGYYTNWYPAVYSPGYYVEDRIYFLEVNFYDAKSEALTWSAQSETYNPSSLESFSKEFSNVIVMRMKKDGVLK